MSNSQWNKLCNDLEQGDNVVVENIDRIPMEQESVEDLIADKGAKLHEAGKPNIYSYTRIATKEQTNS